MLSVSLLLPMITYCRIPLNYTDDIRIGLGDAFEFSPGTRPTNLADFLGSNKPKSKVTPNEIVESWGFVI